MVEGEYVEKWGRALVSAMILTTYRTQNAMLVLRGLICGLKYVHTASVDVVFVFTLNDHMAEVPAILVVQ